MTANAEIILEEKKDVLLVREAAIVYDRDRNASIEVPDPTAETGRRKVSRRTRHLERHPQRNWLPD